MQTTKLTGIKVLVVEDSSATVRIISRMLDRWGCQIVGNTDRGSEAVKLARELKPDLILLDVGLADEIDGIKAAQQIRTFSKTPIIFLTASPDELQGHLKDAQTCFSKQNFDSQKLSEAILLALKIPA